MQALPMVTKEEKLVWDLGVKKEGFSSLPRVKSGLWQQTNLGRYWQSEPTIARTFAEIGSSSNLPSAITQVTQTDGHDWS